MPKKGFRVLIPMKNPYDSKSRLAKVFSRNQRAELSLNMLARVVTASKLSLADNIAVVGGEFIASCANEHEVDWIHVSSNDLNEDLYAAMCLSVEDDFVPIYLPGDVPFLTPDDINEVIKASHGGSEVVLVPSGHDGGTNCFLNPFFLCFKPLLGIDSFRRHIEFAEMRNVPFSVRRLSGLLLDLDTEDDLRRCNAFESGFIKRLGKPM